MGSAELLEATLNVRLLGRRTSIPLVIMFRGDVHAHPSTIPCQLHVHSFASETERLRESEYVCVSLQPNGYGSRKCDAGTS